MTVDLPLEPPGRQSPQKSAPAMVARKVSKTFGGTKVLCDLDMTILPGEVRMVVGGNGSGKSTFIKILSGYHDPDDGASIEIDGHLLHTGHAKESHRLGARFVHQDLGLVEDASVVDNLFLNSGFPTLHGAVRDRFARRQCVGAMEELGMDIDPRTLVRDLSAAQRTALAIARALNGRDQQPIHLLVLDEPTATLPITEVGVLLGIVRSVAASGVGVLYVTHRLDEVYLLSATVSVMRNGRLVLTRAAADLTRSNLLREIVGSDSFEAEIEASRPTSRRVSPVLRAANLCGAGVNGISLEVAEGEMVGLCGVTGSGRELVNPTVFGGLRRDAGSVKVGESELPANRPDLSIRAGVGFMPSDRRVHGGMMDLSATENLTIGRLKEFWRPPWLRQKVEKSVAKEWFERLSVRPLGAYDQPLSSFSGGNQQKLLLGKWLRLSPRVLLLEEPTQGVDVAAKKEIYHQLRMASEAGSAVMISSADLDELVELCSRVFVLRDGKVVACLSGTSLDVASLTRESLLGELSQVRHLSSSSLGEP